MSNEKAPTLIQGLNLDLSKEQDITKPITVSDWETYDDVITELSMHGIGDIVHPPNVVEGSPRVTAEILAGLDPKEHGEWMAKFVVWQNYMTTVAAHLEAQIKQVKNIIEKIEREGRASLKEMAGTYKMTQREIQDRIEQMPEHESRRITLQKLEQQMGFVSANLSNLKITIQAMSRNIELRKLDPEAQRLVNNLPYRGRM